MDGEGYNLYKAWVELRRHNGHSIASINLWRATIVEMCISMIDVYQNVSDVFMRSNFVETFNLHLAIHIMGGLKRHPKWETKCQIMITE